MAASWAKKEKDEPDPPSEEEGESKWEMLKKKVLKEGKEESEDAFDTAKAPAQPWRLRVSPTTAPEWNKLQKTTKASPQAPLPHPSDTEQAEQQQRRLFHGRQAELRQQAQLRRQRQAQQRAQQQWPADQQAHQARAWGEEPFAWQGRWPRKNKHNSPSHIAREEGRYCDLKKELTESKQTIKALEMQLVAMAEKQGQEAARLQRIRIRKQKRKDAQAKAAKDETSAKKKKLKKATKDKQPPPKKKKKKKDKQPPAKKKKKKRKREPSSSESSESSLSS